MTSKSHIRKASRLPRRAAVGGLLAMAALAPVGNAAATPNFSTACTRTGTAVHCDLWAKSGTVTLPGATTLPVLGYSSTAADPAVLPGPTLVATAGDTVTVTLHNTLAQKTGLLFQEQAIEPDTMGAAASVGTKDYTFTATLPGTYLYEASPFVPTSGGGGSQYQTAMGMSGTLVVRPSIAGQAYDAPSTAFADEQIVQVGELDKELANAANPALFDMRNYAPDYYLVNGKASPATDDLSTGPNQKVLLRYVNAGIKAHSLALLGLDQTVVGEDGNALEHPRHMVAETFGAGQTEDVIVDTTGASGRYAVYEAGMWMNNANAPGMGGMLTFLGVSGGAIGDTVGPTTGNVAYNGSSLTASVTDVGSGGSNVNAAEYFVDTLSAPGAGTAFVGDPFGSPTVALTEAVSVAPGSHTIYVRGRDAAGNWGAVSSVLFTNADATGPTSKGLGLSPNPSNGSTALLLKATADDSASGGAQIAAGYYAIDGPVLSSTDLAAVTTNMTPNGPGAVAALDTTIPVATLTPLGQGPHTVRVYAKDGAGNWGGPAAITLVKDATGPAGSNPAVAPTPNNGAQPFSATVQAVRVSADFADANLAAATDPIAGVAAGEGFIDAAGAIGTGFPLVPVDGTFGGATETLRADIPLSKIATLSAGPHAILLRAKDGAGNWGGTVSANLVIDKTAPALSGVAASPASVDTALTAATTFALNATATDASGVTRVEWFSGTDPGVGNGTALALVSGSAYTAGIDWVLQGWGRGPRTISVRARDAAGNWSALATTTFTVTDSIFANGFQSNNASGWNGGTTGSGRISFPTASDLGGTGTRSMQVSVAGTINAANPASAYVTDNRPSAEPFYRARFYVNPNGSTPGGGTAGVTLLGGYSGNNGSGATLFSVRYRLNGGNRQVQLGVGAASTAWTTIAANAASYVEVGWQTSSTSVQFRVNGVLTTLTVPATGGAGVQSVRLGVQGLTGANATRNGSVRLDSFASTRRTVVGP